jgi:hypothetical protein
VTDRDDPLDETKAFDPMEETKAYDPLVDTGEETVADAGAGDATRAIDPLPVYEHAATQRISSTPVADTGPGTERIALAQQRSLAGWLIALILIVALGVGVAVGYSQAEGGDEGVEARALVGPNGGVLNFADGAGKLEIPPGALPTATAITVRKVTNATRFRLGPESDPSSVLYEPGQLEMFVFEPAGLNLQAPAKITLPRPADGSALLVDTPDGPRVVGADAQGNSVKIETSSFSFEDL